mgnify:CR=1 FL=1
MQMFKNLFSTNSSNASNEDSSSLKGLIENMTKALVDDPSRIQVAEVRNDDENLVYELRVSKSDLGKVIGKRGRTASAMRTILSAASRKHNLGVDLKIVE